MKKFEKALQAAEYGGWSHQPADSLQSNWPFKDQLNLTPWREKALHGKEYVFIDIDGDTIAELGECSAETLREASTWCREVDGAVMRIERLSAESLEQERRSNKAVRKWNSGQWI